MSSTRASRSSSFRDPACAARCWRRPSRFRRERSSHRQRFGLCRRIFNSSRGARWITPGLRRKEEDSFAAASSATAGSVSVSAPQFAIRSAGSRSRLMPAEATRSVMTSVTVVMANSSNGYITQSSFWPGRRLLGFSGLSGFVVALMLAPPPCPLPPSIVSNLRGSLAFWWFACAVALAFDGRAGVRRGGWRLPSPGFACLLVVCLRCSAGVRREGWRFCGEASVRREDWRCPPQDLTVVRY